MIELYYDCPLQAAIMAKEFGVEYEWSGKLEPQESAFGLIIVPARYYIHPDSLPIFEPKYGDKGIAQEGKGATCGFFNKWEVLVAPEESVIDKVHIIYRNKPFFTPKEET